MKVIVEMTTEIISAKSLKIGDIATSLDRQTLILKVPNIDEYNNTCLTLNDRSGQGWDHYGFAVSILKKGSVIEL